MKRKYKSEENYRKNNKKTSRSTRSTQNFHLEHVNEVLLAKEPKDDYTFKEDERKTIQDNLNIDLIDFKESPLRPIVIKIKRAGGEKPNKTRYDLPSLPITPQYLPRCTTAFNESHFGHFNTRRYKEYKLVRDNMNNQDYNKFTCSIDPIYHVDEVSLKKSFDYFYFKNFYFRKYRRKESE